MKPGLAELHSTVGGPKKSRALLGTTRAATGERGAAAAATGERNDGNLVLQSCCLGKQRGSRLTVEHLQLHEHFTRLIHEQKTLSLVT